MFEFPNKIIDCADDVWVLKEVKDKKAIYFNPLRNASSKHIIVTKEMVGTTYRVLE